jgi:heat shock protein HtpX
VFGFLLFVMALGGYLSPGLLGVAVLAMIAPYAGQYLQASLMRTLEKLADRDAAALTGDPRSLASALAKLERYNRYISG